MIARLEIETSSGIGRAMRDFKIQIKYLRALNTYNGKNTCQIYVVTVNK
jgi:hypothetical protein